VRALVLLEPAQVRVDVLRADVKSASGHTLAQLFRRRVDFGLEERADTARFTFPPHKAKYRSILFPRYGGEPIDRS